MCDAYDLFVINLVLVILKILYKEGAASAGAISTAALWGAVSGQIFFGLIADKIGRKKGYLINLNSEYLTIVLSFIITLTLVIIGAIGSALAFNTSAINVFVFLAVWRFVLGFGIGGEVIS
jgi:PHS family inorganic phosphate transporter-like MFS transporter